MDDRTALRALVFESLEEQVALVDEAGAIVDVNASWTRFGAENGVAPQSGGIGCNYLDVVRRAAEAGDPLAGDAARGISDVLGGASAGFHHEYPCHGPTGKRWFMMRMCPLKGHDRRMFIVSHADITQRRLAEDRAHYLAAHDPLTGLANRRTFDEFLNGEMRRGIRDGSTLSLVLIDVDHFKEYNDLLGHLAGDRCLARIARTLHECSRRPGDLAARIGGDEFALVLGATRLADAQSIADAFGKAVAELGLSAGSRELTVSVGIACVAPEPSTTAEMLMQEADRALYAAKSTGRNRVASASSSLDAGF